MALKVDPTTGAVYDDGTPEPPGIPAELAQPLPWTPPPDAQAAIDAVMGVPQVQPADVPAAVDAVSGGAQPPTQLDSLRAAMTAGQATPEQNTRRAELEAAARSPGGIPVADAIELARMRDQEDADNAALRGGGRPGDMTPERLAALAEPAYTPPADPQVGPNGTLLGGGGSVSTAESGYSSEAEAKIGKGAPLQGALSANDALKAQAEADYNAALAESDAILAAQRKAAAEQAQVESDELEAALDTEKKYQEDQQKAWSKLEAGLIAAEAEAEATKQRYLQDRAAASAMVVDPSAAWRGKSGAAMGIAMMAQGWLANMGPGSPVLMDVQGMIDKIVQDNISAQTANRANAWKTVEASDNLWALARDGAEDEVEAYTRYKGFLTDAYNTQVKVNALKFAGPKAAAAAAAADAAMVADASARAKALRDEKYARMSDIQKQDYDAHMTWLKESQATKRTGMSTYASNLDAKTRARQAGATEVQVKTGVPVLDPDNRRTGWVVSFDGMQVPSGVQDAVLKKAALAPTLYRAGQRVLETFNALKGDYAGSWGRLTSGDTKLKAYTQAQAAYKNVLQQWGNTGAALTDNETSKMTDVSGTVSDNPEAILVALKQAVGMDTPDYARTIASGIMAVTDEVEAGLSPYLAYETAEAKAALDARGTGASGGPFAGVKGKMRVLAEEPAPGDTSGVAKVSARASGVTGKGKRRVDAFAPVAAEIDPSTWAALQAPLDSLSRGDRENRNTLADLDYRPYTEARTPKPANPDDSESFGENPKMPPSYLYDLYALYLRTAYDDADGRDASAELAKYANSPSTFKKPTDDALPETAAVAKILYGLPRPSQATAARYLKGELEVSSRPDVDRLPGLGYGRPEGQMW